MSRRPPTSSAHIHVVPVAVPRAPGLHAVARPGRKTPSARFLANMPISNASSRAIYDGAELRAHVRPGSQVAFSLPSRVGNRLHFPDGRVTDLQGNYIGRSA